MRGVIVKTHAELILADGRADIPHHGLDLGPRMHARAVVVSLMVVVFERPVARAPGPDAEDLLLVAEIFVVELLEAVVAGELAPGRGPAVLGLALGAGFALAERHGGRGGAAGPGEGGDGAGLVRVVFDFHVGGDLGLRVDEVVLVGAQARGLPERVELHGPPDRIPDFEVLVPVVVVDGARIGGVPWLVDVEGVFGGVGMDGIGLLNVVAEDSDGDAVEDGDGTGGWCGRYIVGHNGQG